MIVLHDFVIATNSNTDAWEDLETGMAIAACLFYVMENKTGSSVLEVLCPVKWQLNSCVRRISNSMKYCLW